MDHFIDIYTRRAADYHPLIAAEDADGNLPRALRALTPFAGRRVLDLGTGTGRLPLLLAREAAQLVGVDLYADMLRQNRAERERVGGRWPLLQGDMRRLPVASAAFDVITAGWAIGHLRGWTAPDWQTHIGAVLREMQRVARPGGALIILETLGTGSLTPAPPTAGLAEYYAWLEADWGFARREIRTDYQFASVDEAVAQTEFFFGPELSARIRANGWARLPEWTGVWHKPMA
jgi:ubiquinone/menaquinone biosynthesis C-methylase UbiE